MGFLDKLKEMLGGKKAEPSEVQPRQDQAAEPAASPAATPEPDATSAEPAPTAEPEAEAEAEPEHEPIREPSPWAQTPPETSGAYQTGAGEPSEEDEDGGEDEGGYRP